MKWKGWIGGVLLVMMLFGTLGCGKRRGSVTGGMVDGPGILPGMWQPSQMRRADICTFR